MTSREELYRQLDYELGDFISKDRLKRYSEFLTKKPFLSDISGIDITKGGLLSSNDIIRLSDSKQRELPLIDPFEPDDHEKLLKSASYLLRLGSHYRVGDKEGHLTLDNPTITIPKHGIAIVTTYEWVNIPTFLIARWNLRVHKVYEGLVWVGGPQVDPGYQGFLFCPIYNLSHSDQTLTYKRGLFTMDFQYTSSVSEAWSPRIEDRTTYTFKGLDKKRIKSGPEEEFIEMRRDISNIRRDVQRSQGVVFSMISILVAALAIMATLNATSGWNQYSSPLVLSIFSIIISLCALVVTIVSRH